MERVLELKHFGKKYGNVLEGRSGISSSGFPA